MEEKWELTQKGVEKALQPSKFIRWLTNLGILIVAIGVLLLIFYFISNGKKVQDQPADIESHSNGTNEIGTNSNSGGERKYIETEKKALGSVVSEDFSSYINKSITNSSSNTGVSVTVVDERGNIISSISHSIAKIYSEEGNNGNTGLLRSSFIQKLSFQELFEGNSEIIEKLKLSNYTDYIVLGKIIYSRWTMSVRVLTSEAWGKWTRKSNTNEKACDCSIKCGYLSENA